VEKRLSRWGVGPKTIVPGVLYTIVAWVAASVWPAIFRLSLPDPLGTIGIVLIGLGIVMWFFGVITVMPAYSRDQLVTTGVFALVRHPIYSAWITLIFPGLGLVAGAWPMFLTPFIAYATFKHFIGREDEYLTKRYGEAYLDYRRRVNEVIPIPRFR
jgi:protein-S-isoprenylcysteine O-methyltransferase Ste14